MSSELNKVEQLPATGESQLEKRASRSSDSLAKDRLSSTDKAHDPEAVIDEEEVREHNSWIARHNVLVRRLTLAGLAALILGWWISATVLPATRHRWIPQTFWAWFFLIVIAFRFIPNSVVTRPVEAIWQPLVSRPFFSLPWPVRLTIGWLVLLAIVFGSAFGFKLENGTKYGDRAISVLGLAVFQFCFWLASAHRSHVPWPTVIVGLFIQQAIALFVLKSDAGFSIFKWIANLSADFLAQAKVGAIFFFDADTINEKQWFFVNTLATIIFFIAFVQMMYYLGVMQWLLKNFAWFFFKTMNVSGAEAVVAAASPFIGQGESACLVAPYVDFMTDSELHLIMTSGFSTIAGSVLGAYINLGVPAQNLITASVMSIPASIAISKMRLPEIDDPVTRGRVVVDRGEAETKNAPANALHAFAKGAVFGLVVAGQILCNVLTILSLVATINGLLTWVGRGFGFHHLTLQLILRYIFYPITFFLGVPRSEILRVSELLATKLVENEFAAYLDLEAIKDSTDPLSHRSYTIASYALCGFSNLGSLGINIGVLAALAPSRAKAIARLAPSAMICGFISTLQAAGIAGMLI